MQRAQSDDKARHASLRAVTDAAELDVSIDGQPLAHRLYHFCLECPLRDLASCRKSICSSGFCRRISVAPAVVAAAPLVGQFARPAATVARSP